MKDNPSDSEKQPPTQPKKLDLFGRGSKGTKNVKKLGEGAEMLERILEMQRDLKEKLDYIHEQGKICNIDVDAFFRTPMAEISPTDIAILKEKEGALRKLLEAPAETTPQTATPKEVKSEDKLTKERKGKTRGVRNKWIPL